MSLRDALVPHLENHIEELVDRVDECDWSEIGEDRGVALFVQKHNLCLHHGHRGCDFAGKETVNEVAEASLDRDWGELEQLGWYLVWAPRFL